MGELAAPHAMSLPAISRHLKVLESAGLVVKGRDAQWRRCRLDAEPLREVDAWMAPYRTFFEARLDRLDVHLQTMVRGRDAGRTHPENPLPEENPQ